MEDAPASRPARRRKSMPLYASVPLWFLLTGLGLAVSMLPRRAELWLGPRLGRAALALGLFKRRVAAENLANCFPELSPERRAALLRRNYEHMGNLFFEYLHMFSPVPGHYAAYARANCVLEGAENWERAAAKGKGVLFFSCHVGWWEMVAASAGLTGKPLTIVTTVLEPAWLHRRITEARRATGVEGAFHPGSVGTVLRALRKKESVAFMNDQYAPPPMGMPVEFFGVEVATLAAIGPLALRTGAAIVPGYGYRDRDGVMRVRIEPELEFEPSDLQDARKVTQALAYRVERWVRRHPEQWLWIHRRFKNVDWSARA